MTAKIIKIDTAHPESAFSHAREVVRAGGVIAYPTDTFYGLGVDPRNPEAVRRLFEIKGRRADQPILLLLQDAGAVLEWASGTTASAERMMKQFWPGPLTLVFTAKPDVLPELTGGTGTIGLRVPGNELTRSLLRFLGAALTGTSANRSGGTNPRTAAEVVRDIGDMVDVVLDGGASPGGEPSTVLDVTVEPPKVIRQGAVLLTSR